jgi:hypothetical protein
MKYQQVRTAQSPVALGKERHQVALDALRVGVSRQPEEL